MDKIYHFSAPGRTEIGGNHTDHQHGCVIAAAVDMTTTAEVTLNGTNVIRVDSEGLKEQLGFAAALVGADGSARPLLRFCTAPCRGRCPHRPSGRATPEGIKAIDG